MIKKHNISLFTFILLIFTACGGGGTTSSNDVPIHCEPAPLNSLHNKNAYSPTIEIDNPGSEPKLLLHTLADTPTPLTTTVEFDKAGLYGLFQTEYYWASQTSNNFDYTAYSTPQSLIDDLKHEKDRWSFAITKEAYADLTSQKSDGFGFFCQDVSNGCHVTYVRIDSPADKVGLKRGDVISRINEEDATQALLYETADNLGVLSNFKIERDNRKEVCTCKITPRDYTYKVAQAKIINTNNHQNVGYFRFDSFLGDESIIQEINEAFDTFKKAAISKLVIDFRYNGGGSVDVASALLNKLTNTHNEASQFTLAWNDDHQKNNETYTFKTEENSLYLEQLLFLTTKDSASASELVISAMKPYMEESKVVVIGEDTHGKPVGMGGRSDESYYYFLINFVVKNSIGFYDYFNGLPVTAGCDINDDPYHEMGDSNELMLKAALNYVDTGSCQ
ncbi:hypothetical protein KKC13_02380 [bacterium]|nr:hypothetical protein [bacterium]MBU1959129.1 hypothetical protein [bacterium]